jgi:ABC-2 type transport system ATP-binding protein
MDYILQTEDLTKVYSKKKVVEDVNISIRKGAIYGLIGKNGAGKTTIIRMITGLASPTSGKVVFFEDMYNGGKHSKISAVIESPSIFPFFSAAENLEVQRIALGIKDKGITKKLLEDVGLHDIGNKKAKVFSLGMRQRLGIAIALLGDPEFLFLDEPINGLDPVGVKEVRNLILELNRKGTTIMISSHILSELAKIATDYGVMYEGKLIKQFRADELKIKTVSVRVNDTDRALKVLITKLGLNDYYLNGNEIKVKVDNVGKSGEISSAFAENDIIIESITTNDGDSEDYFIRLMGGEK